MSGTVNDFAGVGLSYLFLSVILKIRWFFCVLVLQKKGIEIQKRVYNLFKEVKLADGISLFISRSFNFLKLSS